MVEEHVGVQKVSKTLHVYNLDYLPVKTGVQGIIN